MELSSKHDLIEIEIEIDSIKYTKNIPKYKATSSSCPTLLKRVCCV